MRRALLASAVVLIAAAPLGSRAATFTYQTIDNPADRTFNQLLGINDAGLIAGYYGSAAVGHPNQGYTIPAPYKTFTPANLPGSVQTQATGLNGSGLLTGFWSDTNLGSGDANYGFIRQTKGSVTTYLDVNNPLVGGSAHVTQVLGVNTAGTAAGFYNDAAGASHAFTYSVTTGRFTNTPFPPTITAAAATGINANNLLSGFATNKAGRTEGFVRPLSGNAAFYGAPGSANTQFLGIDDAGEAVGFYIGADTFPHGVIYDSTAKTAQFVNAPLGAMGTVLNGVNNKNQIVGFYTDAAGNTHGLLVTVTP